MFGLVGVDIGQSRVRGFGRGLGLGLLALELLRSR